MFEKVLSGRNRLKAILALAQGHLGHGSLTQARAFAKDRRRHPRVRIAGEPFREELGAGPHTSELLRDFEVEARRPAPHNTQQREISRVSYLWRTRAPVHPQKLSHLFAASLLSRSGRRETDRSTPELRSPARLRAHRHTLACFQRNSPANTAGGT